MKPVSLSRRQTATWAAGLLLGLALTQPSMAKTKRVRKPKTSSDAERQKLEDERLKRECKGRPNAGACLGYAS